MPSTGITAPNHHFLASTRAGHVCEVNSNFLQLPTTHGGPLPIKVRSRGWRTIKIDLLCDGPGHPYAILLTVGTVADITAAATVVSAVAPTDELVGSRGYDANRLRCQPRLRRHLMGVLEPLPGIVTSPPGCLMHGPPCERTDATNTTNDRIMWTRFSRGDMSRPLQSARGIDAPDPGKASCYAVHRSSFVPDASGPAGRERGEQAISTNIAKYCSIA